MPDSRIKYVEKSADSHDKITEVGAENWRWTVKQVIDSIVAKTNTFHTIAPDGFTKVEVDVVDGRYLRTKANGKWTDNLLSLPRFPK